MRKSKKGFFFVKIAWHYFCQEGRKTCIFVHTICFGQKLFGPKQTKKHYKNSGFNGNCPKPKMTPFFGERCLFDMGEKVGFTNSVFEKLCFSENTIFIVFSENTAIAIQTLYVNKRTENWWKIVGCFWTWQKGVFCLFLFSGFNVSLCFCLVKLQEC